jgi:hypothetical protein
VALSVSEEEKDVNDIIESWTLQAGNSGSRYGFQVVVSYDAGTRPEHSDCYSAADVVGWKQDQWQYVVFTVTPFLPGITFDGAAQVLGGVEWGFLGGRWLDKEYAMSSHPVPDMMTEAAAAADEIRRKLT